MSSVGEDFAGIRAGDSRRAAAPGLSRFMKHDTLVAKITPCLENGKVAFVQGFDDELALGSTEFIVLSPHEGVDPRFLFHLVCSYEVRGRAIARMEGSTGRQRVPEEIFIRRLIVPIPPLDEQRAIARVLDAVAVTVAETRLMLAHAQALDHSLLHSLLRQGLEGSTAAEGEFPSHWTVVSLDEVAEVGSGLTLGKGVSGAQAVELPYLRVANVQDGHLDLSTIKKVRVPVTDAPHYRLESGDVLMTEGGDIDKLGRGTIWSGQIEDCLHQNHIFRIRTNHDVLVPEFYSLIVESDIAKRYFSRVAKRTTNLASTNKTQVRAFRFPVPPTIAEQEEIVGVMEVVKATISALAARQTALNALAAALAADLLAGRVRVSQNATPAAQ
jgi:type I restriction enzyme S subunit